MAKQFSKITSKADKGVTKALQMFKSAYDTLVAADEILTTNIESIKEEQVELDVLRKQNERQLEANTKVRENLKQFLPNVTDEL